MGRQTLKGKVEEEKNRIQNYGYTSYKSYNRDFGGVSVLTGTMYLKEVMDYGFHIYFIHEPGQDPNIITDNGTLTEMYYDLRHKDYWIKRNLREVRFSERNIDTLFPNAMEDVEKVFTRLSTKNNKGLYLEAWKQLGRIGAEIDRKFGRFLHRLITRFSYFELLYKSGIESLKRVRIVNPNGNSPREILGLTKTQWKLFTQYSCNQNDLCRYNDPKADQQAINYLAYVKSLDEEFGVGRLNTFASNEIEYIYKGVTYNCSALKIANDYELNPKRLVKYLYFECDVSQGLSVTNAHNQYSDYVRMTTEMGYERFEKYPKFLRTYHDIAHRNYNIKLNAEQLEQWNNELEKNKQYQWRYGDYMIFPPETPEDLRTEGNVLSHCVSSYANKVRKGISTILFLREKADPEHPLVTVEIKGGKIVQARGKMNFPPKQEEKEAIRRFAKKFNLEPKAGTLKIQE